MLFLLPHPEAPLLLPTAVVGVVVVVVVVRCGALAVCLVNVLPVSLFLFLILCRSFCHLLSAFVLACVARMPCH